jgi:hypothetical protein
MAVFVLQALRLARDPENRRRLARLRARVRKLRPGGTAP